MNGKKYGRHWKRVDGNAFLFGELNEDNKPHGESIFYFYPDLCTVLRGSYINGTFQKGRKEYIYIYLFSMLCEYFFRETSTN